jgi:microcystin degradation protein MlrC
MGFRVAVIEFAHESNTFSPKPADLHAFEASRLYFGDEILREMRDTNSEIGGCIDVAECRKWDLVPILSAHAQPCGPVTEETRRNLTDEAVRRIEAAKPLDGVFVSLHGAMVTETSQDGESQFLSEIRSVVGKEIPIAVTLDLHANVFDQMSDLVDIAVSYRTYPHVDMRERGREAAEVLHRALAGEIAPFVVVERPAMLVGCDDGRTSENGPMCRILEHAEREADAPGLQNVSVNAGFTDADVFAAGPSVLVTGDNKAITEHDARDAAQRICGTIREYRHEWFRPMSLSEGIERLRDRPKPGKPIVVADFADNPGSGAHGDCTAILSALLQAELGDVALGALYDPEAAKRLAEAGEGAEVTLSVGGKTDPSIGGGPLTVSGRVMAVSDGRFTFEGPLYTGLAGKLGTSVAFRIRGIDVMITSEKLQMFDLNIFRAVGIEPAERSIVVVKSMQHFRGAFAPIASEILVVDAGGLSSPDLSRRVYRNLRRPVFPLDFADA